MSQNKPIGGLVLVVTAKDEVSVSRVIGHLNELQQPYFRLDVDTFIALNGQMSLELSNVEGAGSSSVDIGSSLDLTMVKSVWYRRPKKLSASEVRDFTTRQFIEDEFSATLWSLYTSLGSGVSWMNHPLYGRDWLEHNKLLQLKLARESGLVIPDTLVTNNPQKVIAFCESKGGSIALKPVKSRTWTNLDGSIDGIYTQRVTTEYLRQKVGAIAKAPMIAQEYVQKRLELRVTVVGRHALACAIHSQNSERTRDDWRRYDFTKVKHEQWELPLEVQNKLFCFMDKCHLSYGAIDMILTPEGEYVFLEINPSGQYIWIENLVGLPISKTIAETLAGV